MKVYDGFMFFNELELLEIRLNELYDVVDNFIIVESTKTHQNKEKPLYYLENKNRFSKFNDKIIHHVFNPTEMPYPWYIENEQRNQIKNANFKLEEEDFLFLSDADEILKKEAVVHIKENLHIFKKIPHVATMLWSYNYINTIVSSPVASEGWRGTVIIPYTFYNKYPLQFFRDKKDELPRLANAGWHLSFIGGATRIKQKIESYAHSEFNTNELTDLLKIKSRLDNLEDPLSRGNYIKLSIEKDNAKFPVSSLKYRELFYEDT